MRTALDRAVMARAVKGPLIAGTLYNLINPGDKVACLAFGKINYLKLFLTYLMPFLVSTYTAVSIKMTSGHEIPRDQTESVLSRKAVDMDNS